MLADPVFPSDYVKPTEAPEAAAGIPAKMGFNFFVPHQTISSGEQVRRRRGRWDRAGGALCGALTGPPSGPERAQRQGRGSTAPARDSSQAGGPFKPTRAAQPRPVLRSLRPCRPSQVDLVLIPAVTGDFGAMPGHVPTVAQLRPGVVTVHKELDKDVRKYFVRWEHCAAAGRGRPLCGRGWRPDLWAAEAQGASHPAAQRASDCCPPARGSPASRQARPARAGVVRDPAEPSCTASLLRAAAALRSSTPTPRPTCALWRRWSWGTWTRTRVRACGASAAPLPQPGLAVRLQRAQGLTQQRALRLRLVPAPPRPPLLCCAGPGPLCCAAPLLLGGAPARPLSWAIARQAQRRDCWGPCTRTCHGRQPRLPRLTWAPRAARPGRSEGRPGRLHRQAGGGAGQGRVRGGGRAGAGGRRRTATFGGSLTFGGKPPGRGASGSAACYRSCGGRERGGCGLWAVGCGRTLQGVGCAWAWARLARL